jgi:Cu/Ag efflux protein CusF
MFAPATTAAPAAFAAGSMDGMDMKAPIASQQMRQPVSAEVKKIDTLSLPPQTNPLLRLN